MVFADGGAAIDTTATFSTPGTYVLRLMAEDGPEATTADVTVEIRPPGTGQAVSLDGVDDYVELADTSLGDVDFTIEAWVQTTDNGWILGNGEMSDLRITTGKVLFQYYSGLFESLTGQTVVADGVWHHIVAIREGCELLIYVDGELDASRSLAGTNHNLGFLAIGQKGDGPGYMACMLDEMRVYSRALSEAEILDHYNGGDGIKGEADDVGLVAGWHFDEGQGIVTADYTGNFKTGVLRNGATWGPGIVDLEAAQPDVPADFDGDVDGADFLIWQQ